MALAPTTACANLLLVADEILAVASAILLARLKPSASMNAPIGFFIQHGVLFVATRPVAGRLAWATAVHAKPVLFHQARIAFTLTRGLADLKT
jgi:hypothetical protein